MNENKNRYELIIGFVTLMLSFSAFKDELKAINVELGFYAFTLADYLLTIVYGFGICIYLYIIERIARQSKKLSAWKIVGYLEKFAFLFFVFIISTPILIVIAFVVYAVFDKATKLEEQQKASASAIISLVLSIASTVLSGLLSGKYFRAKWKSRLDEIESEEIVELEQAVKLFNSGFYSQSILEAFKVLETHLIKLLGARQIFIQRHQFNFSELFSYANKLELLDMKDIKTVHEIRKMRNSAAHLDEKHTQEQAAKALEFIKYLIQKKGE
jgi:hypothetical protein